MVRIQAWGTWEELLLGDAVRRHGSRNWDAVLSELRTRAFYGYRLTPEVCKAKYKDVRKRYSGSKSWFDELRSQRITELKMALEQSEETIGILEIKLLTLKASAEEDYCHLEYTESPLSIPQTNHIQSPCKQSSKYELSAGSFIQTDSMLPATPSVEDLDTTRPELSEPSNPIKESTTRGSIENLAGEGFQWKGKGKRRICRRNLRAGGIHGATSALRSAYSSTRQNCVMREEEVEHLMRIFDSVREYEKASIFRRPLDSQKRSRFKNIVRRHMDLDTIEKNIRRRSISSLQQLFRDLLLLANNTIILYCTRSREYKTALRVRDFITKLMKSNCRHAVDDARDLSTSPLLCNLPAKSRIVHQYKEDKLNRNQCRASDESGKEEGDADSEATREVVQTGKDHSLQGKSGRGRGCDRGFTPGHEIERKKPKM